MKPHLIALVLLLDAVSTGPASACSCAESSLTERLAHASAVFTGQVISLRQNPRTRGSSLRLGKGLVRLPGVTSVKYRFRVLRSWKNAQGKTVEVWSTTEGSMCGYSFEPSQQYLVFALRGRDGRLWTGLCAGNELAVSARARLDSLAVLTSAPAH